MNQQTILNKELKLKALISLLFADERFIKFSKEDKKTVVDLVVYQDMDFMVLPKIRKAYIKGLINGLIK